MNPKTIKGNILDIGASIKIPDSEKPIDFKKVRKQVFKSRQEKFAHEIHQISPLKGKSK